MTKTDDWFGEETATFGDRLAAAREGIGLTPADLAKRLGVKTSTLIDWENDVKEPRANRLSMLSGLLGISLTWLLTGKGDGVGAPDDELNDLDHDTLAILTEMRALRVQLAQNADTLAQLEKRLRKSLKVA